MIRKWLLKGIDKLVLHIAATATPLVLKYYNLTYSRKWHPHDAMRDEALAETVAYIKSNMPDAVIKDDQVGVLNFACKQKLPDGLVLEFGVRTGTTINHIARCLPDRTLYGFDSFEGLPEPWDGWSMEKGTFARESLPEVDSNVQLVKGWFDETLSPFLQEHAGNAALVHIDSDIYSSAKTILDELAPRIASGTIIVFNEYFNYPNWRRHEYRAFAEFCERYRVEYEYLCWGQFEVAVCITAIGDEPKAD
jgi:predicted O-methyltransferase YrrM